LSIDAYGGVENYMISGGQPSVALTAGYAFDDVNQLWSHQDEYGLAPGAHAGILTEGPDGIVKPPEAIQIARDQSGRVLSNAEVESYNRLNGQDIRTAVSNQDIGVADLVTLGVFDNISTAQTYYDAESAVRGRTVEEAISSGILTREGAESLGISGDDYDLARRTQNAMAEIDNSLYRNEDGTYNLEAIIRNNVLSPGDLVLLFGSDDQAEQDKLIQIINDVRDQKIEALGEQYRHSSIRAAGIARTYLDYTVPVYGTVRHWDEMPAWGKALSVAADVVSIIPLVGAAGRGARSFSIATTPLRATEGKLGKAAEAVVGFKLVKPSGMAADAWKALPAAEKIRQGNLATGELWKQIAWAPGLLESAGSLVKPVTRSGETVTGIRAVPSNVRSLYQATTGRVKATTSTLETLLNPYKLPESVVSDSFNTVKLRISDFDSPAEAMAARDKLQKAAMMSGNDIILDTGDKIITLRRSRLMRETGGGLASGTPFGGDFIGGTIVSKVKGNNVRDGLYLAGDPLERFALATSSGIPGDRPAIVILSPETAAKYAQESGKTYKQWVELETVMASGTHIPEAPQKLYTRMGDTGQRIDIYLEKPLTANQIARLKLAGIKESFDNFFSPVITITGKNGEPLSATQSMVLADAIDETSSGLAGRVRFVASDPDGVYNTLEYISVPEVYRIRVNPTAVETPRITTERVDRLPGETLNNFIARASNESYAPYARVSPIGRESTERGRYEEPRLEPSLRTVYSDGTERVPTASRGPTPRIPPVPRAPSGNVEVAVRPPYESVEPPRIYVLPPGSSRKYLTQKEVEASVAWRQGLFWIMRYPPYGVPDDVVWTRTPPTGARLADGPESAYKTIQQITSGAVSSMAPLEMGFERVSIESAHPETPESIKFELMPERTGYRKWQMASPEAAIAEENRVQHTEEFQSPQIQKPRKKRRQSPPGMGTF
jgi:hypothetical protein